MKENNEELDFDPEKGRNQRKYDKKHRGNKRYKDGDNLKPKKKYKRQHLKFEEEEY